MESGASIRSEIRPILKLAFPLIIGQLSQMLLAVADTVMVGRVNVLDLAVLTFVNTLFYVPFVFGIGILTSISVRTSNARGAGDATAARATCRHGFQIALILGSALFLIAWLVTPHLQRFGQPADVTARAPKTFLILMASLIPALGSIALKNHADALNRPWPPFWISMSGVALNVGLNWILVFGKFGFPSLGVEGAAWATLIARWAIVISLRLWLPRARGLRDWVPFQWFRPPVIQEIRHLLQLGLPASLQMLCEVSAFSTAALLVGKFGTTALAAHQIALSCAGTAFMIPLGLSMALSVHIGQANGANDYHKLRPIVLAGWLLAAGFSGLTALAFFAAGNPIAAAFVDQPNAVDLAAKLLVIVGVFQIFDGIQIASASLLRGIHDVRVPAWMGFISYWICGIPLGYSLAFGSIPGPQGIWWGLAGGLTVASITLGSRIWKLSNFKNSENFKKFEHLEE